MRQKVLLVLSFIFISYTVFSQAICGFDGMLHKRMQKDPAFKYRVQQNETNLRSYLQRNRSRLGARTTGTPLYTIPVVVHVVHTGGAIGSIYNPTDAQIKGAIDYLNQVYNGSYPGTQGVGDLQIQFVLAQRDPNCNTTNGINRVDGSSITGYTSGGISLNPGVTPGTDEINVKTFIRWDQSRYYNIWIVNKIDGNDGTSGQFVAGYAYFPGAGSYDGIVMLATQMKTGAKTLPHEIGHAFGLYHPFQGSPDKNTCPANNDCNNDGDAVCDTDPITYNQIGGVIDFSCRTGTNPCTNTAYSANTESNYMNYTNCYTLFTAGQKARMLSAAATSPDRTSLASSNGGTAPSSGTTCLPKINFEITGDQQKEGASAGCKSSFTDYTYNMVIGVGPSASTTATLNVANGNTALEGVDFDITTNGSFTSPSKVVTFPAGSNATQSFTIRVYNDAAIEGTESFTLGFTVNNSGGNAVAGDAHPNFTFKILDNNITPVAGTTTTGSATVGNTSGMIGDGFNASIQKARTQFLYKASELIAAGIPAGYITGLSLYLQKNSTRAFANLNIKMGTIGVDYLVDAPSATAGNPAVVKSLASYSTINGWNFFAFDTPFLWDGASNVIVEVCYDNGTAATDAADYPYSYSDGGTSSQGNLITQSGVSCSESFSSIGYYQNGVKPIINFGYGVTGTVVQTTLNASKSEYLGPFSDVYFYDQSTNKLLARVKNLSNFDYGCTQVVIDRAGTSVKPFWNNNTTNYLLDKTFHIIPTTNNPSGQNQVTLYYTDTEKTGWESATGQSWSNIQLVKVPSQISNYSPSSPAYDGAGAVQVVTPTTGTLGTQYSLTYTFNNGFSGFGAGVPGATITLPTTLIGFDGKLNGKSVLLNWNTSAEVNTRNFEIEKSEDGILFTKIGSVLASGNSNTEKDYSFPDNQLSQDNYYRLRMVDANGHSTLSNVVLIHYNISQNVTVLNNPVNTYIDLRFARSGTSAELQLLNADGAVLSRKLVSVNASQIRWNLSSVLSNGVYILKVTTDNRVFTYKVIKK